MDFTDNRISVRKGFKEGEVEKSMVRKVLPLLVLLSIFAAVFIVQASNIKDIKEARKHAEEKLLPLEGIAGISHRENPPAIIVYVEHEKHKEKVPKEIDGFKTEVIVTGKIKSLQLLQNQARVYVQ